ncbi:cell wall anchor protein [Berryella wangjianweii]|uniref:Cell wall anchor protein n=1 Tax=Berryella wangjianweii TaxID=2734634 RepID=A0A6M8J867_9ACTN|nr:cell wall anchor protein [Berryella wangjianweii]QKF07589.1 cell wall anchor protein [Berryella wangjianweii]
MASKRAVNAVLSSALSAVMAVSLMPLPTAAHAETPDDRAASQERSRDAQAEPIDPAAAAQPDADDATPADRDAEAPAAAAPASADRAAAPQEASEDAAPAALLADPAAVTELWVDGANGSDDKDGSSRAEAFATLAAVLAARAKNPGVTTINMTGAFASFAPVTVPSGVTLRVHDATTANGHGGEGITLAGGSRLECAPNGSLSMSGFKTGVKVLGHATLADGIYRFERTALALSVQANGVVEGSQRTELRITAEKCPGETFVLGPGSRVAHATLDLESASGTSRVYMPEMNLTDASMTLRGMWLEFDPNCKGLNLVKSELMLTNPRNWRGTALALHAPVRIQDGSTLAVSEGRVSAFNTFDVKDSIVRLTNSRHGGLNVSGAKAKATFTDSVLITTGMSQLPSFGAGQKEGPSAITFQGSSLVETDAQNKTTDNGGANRNNGSTYVVTGGSYRMAYDPAFNARFTTPTNGDANGNDELSLLTLADPSLTELKVLNGKGATYTYPVALESSDGNKHVWVPAAKVVFKLNSGAAAFADGTSADKTLSTIGGYSLSAVQGNADPGTPVSKVNAAFLGWFYKDAQGAEQPFNYADTLPIGTREVYAKWDARTVVYHNGAGESYSQTIPADQNQATVLSHDEVVAASPAFAPAGKSFVKWTTDPDGKLPAVPPGSQLTLGAPGTQADLYAQYEDVRYTVAFSANGGTFAAGSVFKKNPDVFEVRQDPAGGEVAVVKAGALHGQKLSEVLGAFKRGQITPAAAAAQRAGSVLASTTEWFSAADGSGRGVRFDDVAGWIISTPGADPSFTADATYYLKWKDDPSVQRFEHRGALDADMWGDAGEGSQPDSTARLRVLADGSAKFSLTTALDAAAVKQQVAAIADRLGADDATPIKLTGLASTFTVRLTLPDGVAVPADLASESVQADGLGSALKVSDVRVQGQTVEIDLALAKPFATYAELKAAVQSMGSQAQARMAGASPIADQITLTVPGFMLDRATVSNGDQLVASAEVKGTLATTASTDARTAAFDMAWDGTQIAAGKSVASTDPAAIEQHILARRPFELQVGADMLAYVQRTVPQADDARRAGADTQHKHFVGVFAGSKVNVTGTLDASGLLNQMTAIESQYGHPADLSQIALSGTASRFVATFTVPKELRIPAGLTPADIPTEGFADTFSVTGVEVAGNTVRVVMELRDGIVNYQQLKDAIAALGSTLAVTVPGVQLADDVADGSRITVAGTVEGSFTATASVNGGRERDFDFLWTGVQTPEGADFALGGAPNAPIQLTLQVPTPVASGVPGDLLSAGDTEAQAVPEMVAGGSLGLTGALEMSVVLQQMNALEASLGHNGANIDISIRDFGFTATFIVPEGMTLPADLTPDQVMPEGMSDLFAVEDVSVAGRVATVRFKLQNPEQIDTYEKLKSKIAAAGVVSDGGNQWLRVTVPSVTIDKTVQPGQQLTAVGEVSGFFKAVAMNRSRNAVKAFSFSWNAEQWAEGRDAAFGTAGFPTTNPTAITFTVKVKEGTHQVPPNPPVVDLPTLPVPPAPPGPTPPVVPPAPPAPEPSAPTQPGDQVKAPSRATGLPTTGDMPPAVALGLGAAISAAALVAARALRRRRVR